MRRRAVLAGMVGAAVVMAACTSDDGVTQQSAAPLDTSATAAESSVGESVTATDSGTASGTDSGTATGSEGTYAHVDLPGLVDTSDAPIANDPDVRTGTLDNGLEYYVRSNDRPGGKADLRLAIHAGSVDEFGEHTGVAHFVEHMLFNGTETYPKNELIDVLRSFGASFGADINAYTSYDETVYSLTVPNDGDSVDTGLNVLDQWLSHATFDPDQVDSERGVILDEWRTRTQTTSGRLFVIAQQLYLDGSAYAGRVPIGTDAAIRDVPPDELKAFYDAWYRPDNAALVVVGDVDPGAIVADLEQRFGDATPRTPDAPARPDTTFPIETAPAFALHADPDQTTVDVEVDLPLPAFEGNGTAALRADALDQIIYDALIRRLDQDVSAGTAPFDEIGPGTNSIVDGLDAPALYAITDPERVDATLQALLDEYERAARYGFTDAEIATAIETVQAQYDAILDGADTIQDTDLADQLVANYLSGSPFAVAADLHDIATAELDAIDADAVHRRFLARWTNTAPHVIISTPEADASAMPTEAEVLAAIDGVTARELEPRGGARDLPDELMTAPAPVEPDSNESMFGTGDSLFDPVRIEYPNGVVVIVNPNDIVDGQVQFRAVSPGGSSLVADADVVDAHYAGDIVTQSGVGDFNQTELEQILADRDVKVDASIDPYTDEFSGSAATTDIEPLLQLLHLYMTAPRFDQVALNQLERFEGPLVADPSSDPDTAGFDALLDARYVDEPRYTAIPTADDFATLDLAGVERVWTERHADAGDWVFVFSGDVDADELTSLANSYLGTLPGDGTVESWVDVSPPPPLGVVRSDVVAGTGDTASVTLLFSSEVDRIDGDLRATADVVTQVVSTRLTDVVREQLGESYSPDAVSVIDDDPTPVVMTYVFITGSPDRVAAVGDLVVEQLADLAANGPTDREFSGALATVQESYNFVNNDGFIEELVNAEIYPERSIDQWIAEYSAIQDVTAGSVQAFVADHIPADQYVEVVVTPRS